MVAVVLEHRAAAGDVVDDRVEAVDRKRGQVLVGELAGRLAGAGVEVDRAAADLRLRHVDVAAVLLQHAGGRPIDVAEHRVADAAGEQRDRRAAPADRGQELGQRAFVAVAAAAACRPSAAVAAAAAASAASLAAIAMRPSRWAIRAGISARRSLSRIGKQAEQDAAVEPIVVLRDVGRRRLRPSPRGTARSACRIARRRGRPFRTPGNRGTVRGGRATRSLSSSLPSVTPRIR